jgi:hypothetical protein
LGRGKGLVPKWNVDRNRTFNQRKVAKDEQEDAKKIGIAGRKEKLGETGTPTMEASSHRAGLATGAL